MSGAAKEADGSAPAVPVLQVKDIEKAFPGVRALWPESPA